MKGMRIGGLVAGLLAIAPAHAEDASAVLGKQRAAGSPIEWEIREAGHPTLGNIRFAYIKRPVETRVGSATVFSRAYFSCQKGVGKLAIELSNATAPADPGGLRPVAEPRLVCSRPTEDGKLVKEELLATWEINEKIGDALTRGLRPFPLRECVSIGVMQEVALPAGSAQKSARIEFEILPYNRALDSIFVACGEVSAYAPSEAPATTVAAAAPAAAPTPAPASAWRKARTVSSGRTNLRARPDVGAPVVVMLPAGVTVLVQQASGDWWHAKSPGGAKFEGYIRQDRLDFR